MKAVCDLSWHLVLSLQQIAAMKEVARTESARPGLDPTTRVTTCWSACASETERASGPANPLVSTQEMPGVKG